MQPSRAPHGRRAHPRLRRVAPCAVREARAHARGDRAGHEGPEHLFGEKLWRGAPRGEQRPLRGGKPTRGGTDSRTERGSEVEGAGERRVIPADGQEGAGEAWPRGHAETDVRAPGGTRPPRPDLRPSAQVGGSGVGETRGIHCSAVAPGTPVTNDEGRSGPERGDVLCARGRLWTGKVPGMAVACSREGARGARERHASVVHRASGARSVVSSSGLPETAERVRNPEGGPAVGGTSRRTWGWPG